MAGEAKLRIEVMADGTARVSDELARVAGATSRVGAAVAGTTGRLAGLTKVTGGVGRMMGGLGRAMTSWGGMIGIGLGAAAMKGAIDNLASFDAGMTTLGHSAGASKQEMAQVGAAITDMAAKAGRPKTELLAAVDAAVGLGMKMQDVVGILQDASNWARLLGVDTRSATVAMGAMGKLAGPNMDRRRMMGMMDVGVRASGMESAQVLQIIGSLAPMLRGQGIEGEQGVEEMLRMFAGVGQFAANPQEMTRGVKSLVGTFRDDAARLGKMGVDVSSLGGMFRSLAGVAHNDARQLKRMGLSDSLVTFITAAGEGYDQIVRFDDGLKNLDLDKFKNDLDAAGSGQAAAWDKIKVQASEIFTPIAGSVLQWLANEENQTKLKAGFQTAGAMLEWFGQALYSLGLAIYHPEVTATSGMAGMGKTGADIAAQYRAENYRVEGEPPITSAARHFLVAMAGHRRQAHRPTDNAALAEDLSYYTQAAPVARRGIEAVRNAAPDIVAGAKQVLQNFIHIHVDPETVHAATDERNGARTETTVTRE